ncbi:MAG TPA: hypothetical protein VF533_03010 [Solirubrobacteraceae bacterium]|jgi:hypothetical protein
MGGAIALVVLAAVLAIVLPKWLGDDPASETAGGTQITGQGPSAQKCKERAEAAGDADGLARAVCGRGFWVETPALYSRSFRRATDDAFEGLATVSGGEVTVVQVEELFRDAAVYEGRPVHVVGRVQRTELLDQSKEFVREREVRLVGRDPTYALVLRHDVLSGAELPEGQTAYSTVFVAARGVARFTGSEQTVDASYALGDEPKPAEGPSSSAGPAIRRAIRALKPR